MPLLGKPHHQASLQHGPEPLGCCSWDHGADQLHDNRQGDEHHQREDDHDERSIWGDADALRPVWWRGLERSYVVRFTIHLHLLE